MLFPYFCQWLVDSVHAPVMLCYFPTFSDHRIVTGRIKVPSCQTQPSLSLTFQLQALRLPLSPHFRSTKVARIHLLLLPIFQHNHALEQGNLQPSTKSLGHSNHLTVGYLPVAADGIPRLISTDMSISHEFIPLIDPWI